MTAERGESSSGVDRKQWEELAEVAIFIIQEQDSSKTSRRIAEDIVRKLAKDRARLDEIMAGGNNPN